MKTYYWDFFGPRAEGTAAHLLRHIEEFFAVHAIADCKLELTSTGGGHRAVVCHAPQAAHEVIERSLRPRRWDDLGQ